MTIRNEEKHRILVKDQISRKILNAKLGCDEEKQRAFRKIFDYYFSYSFTCTLKGTTKQLSKEWCLSNWIHFDILLQDFKSRVKVEINFFSINFPRTLCSVRTHIFPVPFSSHMLGHLRHFWLFQMIDRTYFCVCWSVFPQLCRGKFRHDNKMCLLSQG